MVKRRFIRGDGWRFELIDDELYFVYPKGQGNYKIKDLNFHQSQDEIFYIYDLRMNGHHMCVLRIFIDPLFLYNTVNVAWLVDEIDYFQIQSFLQKILKNI